ncbi:MAG: non-canonical purine NTP pyrophosphatase, partial [Patescibacteria group bacterium]
MAITSFKFKKILIASRNLAKVKDYKKFLKDFSLKVIDLNDLKITKKIKEDGKTFKENAIKKAKFYSQITNLPTIADDSGLEIDYLNGQPGVKSRRWLGYEASDKELINLVLEKLKGVPWKKRKAKLKAAIAFALPKSKVFTFEAETKGFILEKPKGKLIAGYPFRSIFYISKFKKPFSLLSPTEEEKISHRKKALRKLMKILKSLSKIKIRKISLNDLKNAKKFQNYINSLIEEEAMILLNKKKSLKEEKEWLKSKLKNIKNKKEVILIAENKNKIVGISHVKLKKERQNHIGELG